MPKSVRLVKFGTFHGSEFITTTQPLTIGISVWTSVKCTAIAKSGHLLVWLQTSKLEISSFDLGLRFQLLLVGSQMYLRLRSRLLRFHKKSITSLVGSVIEYLFMAMTIRLCWKQWSKISLWLVGGHDARVRSSQCEFSL